MNKKIKQKVSHPIVSAGAVFFMGLIFAAGPALANLDADEAYRMTQLLTMNLEELVQVKITIATGTAKPLKLAPAIATVITTQDIEEMGAATLNEALETVPGLHIIPSNFNRLNPLYTIRGIYTNENPQVLMLMDGTPINSGLKNTRPDGFNISTANIARIEVIRGPGSAMNGADAFAGTINIITKQAAELNGAMARMRTGSFGTTDTALQYGGNHLGWDMAWSLDYMRSDGDHNRVIEADLQTAMDGVFATSASIAPGPLDTDYKIWDGHLTLARNDWTLRMWGWKRQGGEGAGTAQALDPHGEENSDLFFTDLLYRNEEIAPDWDVDLRLGYKYSKTDAFLYVFPAGATLPIGADGNIDFVNTVGLTNFPDGAIGNPAGKEHHGTLDFTALYDGLADHLLRIGTGFHYLSFESSESKNFGPGILDGTQASQDGTLTDVTGTPYIFLDNHHRMSHYLALQDEWAFAKNWELTAGVRYDHYSDFGSTINPRAALVWETSRELTTKLLYGRAFRPPSFTESYFKNNPLSLGNPNLDPETIDTLELAFAYTPNKTFNTSFNVFAYEIDGLIEVIPDTGQSTKTAQNAKNQQGQGFELETNWLLTDTLRLRSNLAYQRSQDKDSHEVVAIAPELQFYLNGHWQFLPQWSLDSQYFWIGNRHREATDTRPEIKNNDIVNLTLKRKKIIPRLDLTMAVRNVFDENIREPAQTSIPNDYPMEGRSFWAEIVYNL